MMLHAVDALSTLHSAASVVLAASDNTDNEGGENQKAGPLGLAIILLLCVACYFLFRSMSRRLRNVRERFPEPEPPTRPGQATVIEPPAPPAEADAPATPRAAIEPRPPD